MNKKIFQKAIFANLYGQAVSVIIQILSLPLFIGLWSPEKYGIWLMITAIPAYIAIADGGVAAVAANKMVFFRINQEMHEFKKLFSTALLVISCVSLLSVVVFFVSVAIASLWIDYIESNIFSICILGLVTALTVFSGISDAIFRPVGMNDVGVYLLNTIRLLEWIFCLIFSYIWGEIIYAAIGMLLARILGCIAIFYFSRKMVPEVSWGFRGINFLDSKRLFLDSVGFVSFPLGNALMIQGGIVIVGSILGPTYVVIYSAYRTISRIITQMLTLISKSLWVGITEMYACGNRGGINSVVVKSIKWTFLFSLTISLIIVLLGDKFLSYWSSGEVGFNLFAMVAMLAATCATSFWQIKMVAIMAVNKHEIISKIYFLLAVIFVGFISFVPENWHIIYLALVHLVYELFMIVIIGSAYKKVFYD